MIDKITHTNYNTETLSSELPDEMQTDSLPQSDDNIGM